MSFQLSPDVDTNKVFVVQKLDVMGRYDPHFHQPKFEPLEAKLDALGAQPLYKLASDIFSGITPLSGGNAYTEEADGIPFIRSGDFNEDGTIKTQDLIYLKPEIHANLMKRSQLAENDVLFAIVGATIGKVGLFKATHEANINQAVGAIRLKSQVRPQFLHAFFLSHLGQQQIERVKRPVARANINLEELGNLRVPVLSDAKQKEVETALKNGFERKQKIEAQAKAQLAGIDALLLRELGITPAPASPNTIQNRVFIRRFSEVTGERFDPIANQPRKLQIETSLQNGKFPTQSLRSLVTMPKQIVNSIESGEIYVGLENIDGLTGEFVKSQEKESVGTAFSFSKNQILFPKLRPYLNKTHLAQFDGLCSTEFHVLVASGIQVEFLTEILRSSSLVGLCSLLMTGTTLPRLQMNDIEQFQIPVPTRAIQEKITAQIKDFRADAKKLFHQAQSELESAKAEIEAMILGSA